MSVHARALMSDVRSLVWSLVGARIELADEQPLYSAGLLGSMRIANLLADLEMTFKVTIPESEVSVDDLDSIAKIAETVVRFGGRVR